MYIDFLIKIKNAERAGKKNVRIAFSKMDYAVGEELVRYGFLKRIEIKGRAPKKTIEVLLNSEKPVSDVKFLSRPSLKCYGKYEDFKPVKSGHGLLVVSTSKGIMSGVRAKKEKVGGQLLFEIW
jgi:small subunit ribosomal protein S8